MSEWKEQGYSDTGNGAIRYRLTNPNWPGVVQLQLHSYCGRERDREWYEADNDPERREYAHPQAAQDRYRAVQREQDADYQAYLRSKRR